MNTTNKTPVEKLADVAALLRRNQSHGHGPKRETEEALETVNTMLKSANVRAALGEVRAPLTLESWLEPVHRARERQHAETLDKFRGEVSE